jgi:hypothetical protein
VILATSKTFSMPNIRNIARNIKERPIDYYLNNMKRVAHTENINITAK